MYRMNKAITILVLPLILSKVAPESQVNRTEFEQSKAKYCSKLTIPLGICSTYSVNSSLLYQGYCPYYFKFGSQLHFNVNSTREYTMVTNISSCAMLSDATCGQLNREGLLCSKCKAGYGPPIYSRTWKCEKCNKNKRYLMWIVYLLLEFTALTVFFIIVIIFNVRATSPPFTAFVFYCHFFTYLFKINVNFHTYVINYVNPYVHKLVFTMTDIWSLEFLRHVVPPFCIDERLTNRHILSLEMIPTTYSLLLIFLTYVSIELHARNNFLITALWRPFNRCVAKVRRSYDPKASILNAFSTVILLSYSNILFIGSRFFYSTDVLGFSIINDT